MGQRMYSNLVVRGTVYATAQEAARALGVTEVTVHMAARLGRLDRLGLGRGRRAPTPVVVRGVTYPSALAVAEAFGVSRRAVYSAKARGALDRIGLPPATPPTMPVIVRGLSFASMSAAAAHFGVTRAAIWRAIDQGRAHRFGERARPARRPREVVICGVTFASRELAAHELGFSVSWLGVLLRRNDDVARDRLLRAVMCFEARRARGRAA